MAKTGLTVLKDNLKKFIDVIDALQVDGVLVGIPENKNARRDEVGNAALGYIHDNGSPARGIPARPFLKQGIKKAEKDISAELKAGAVAALDKFDATQITKSYNRAGLIGQNAVRAEITDGNFEPLKSSTIAARQRAGAKGTKPLIRTGQLRRSISYVVRKRG